MKKKNVTTIPSSNLYYINTAKTLGITLVLFAHLSIPHIPLLFISCLRMPLFFLLSGILYTTKTYTLKEYATHKFKTLMVPYFVFAIASYIFYVAIGHNYVKNGSDSVEQFIKYAIGIFYAPASKEYLGFNIPIWFLPCLFSGEIIFFLMVRYLKKYIVLASIILFFIGILVKEVLPFRLPWGVDVSFFAIIFICVGYLVRKHKLIDKFIANTNLYVKALLVGLSFILTLFFLYLNSKDGAVSVYLLRFNNYILFLLNAFCGITFILSLSIILPNFSVFNFYGRNTIILLGLHLNIFALLKAIQVFLMNIPLSVLEHNFIFNFCYLIATMIVFIPIIIFINKYCPFLIGRKKAILQ